MYDLKDIEARVKSGIAVSVDELIYLFKNNNAALWAFLIQNNPGNINGTLKYKLAYSELGFDPNPEAIAKIINMALQRGEQNELIYVLDQFELKTENLDPNFVAALQTAFSF